MKKPELTPANRAVFSVLLAVAAAITFVAAWMTYARDQEVKRTAAKIEATVTDVRTYEDTSYPRRRRLFRKTTRATFEYLEAGTTVSGYADVRANLFGSEGLSVGERVAVYRYGRPAAYLLDRWPWNYRAAADIAGGGLLFLAVAAATAAPLLRRKPKAVPPAA